VSDVWVVWSFEHDGWWRLGGWGYTRDLAQAGHYREAEAREIERDANITGVINEKAIPLTEAQAFERHEAPLVETELVEGQDLEPGDLFSTAGPEYWGRRPPDAIGEKVYIRTDAPCPPDQAHQRVYRLTIRRRPATVKDH
jgi:hypothetical protein